MKNILLPVMAFLCLYAGNSTALTFAEQGAKPPEMTGLRCMVIWNGHREHLFIQARFEHATGKIAFVIPLNDEAAGIVSEDPTVFDSLGRYLAARGTAAPIEEWPAADTNLDNTAREVLKGARIKDRLRQNGFSVDSICDDSTYALIVYDIPAETAKSDDELITELLRFSFPAAGPHLPVAECKTTVYFFSVQPVGILPDGITPTCTEDTPYYWGRMLNFELEPVKKLFAKSEELKDAQYRLYRVEGSAAGDLQLLDLAMLQVPPPGVTHDLSLRAELAQFSGIASGSKFIDSIKHMTPYELRKLAETLEARAEALRRLIYDKKRPSDTLKEFKTALQTADTTKGGSEEESAKLAIEDLKKFFSDKCWNEKILPILQREGDVGFIMEGRGNAASYEWSVISQVFDRDTATLIVEMSRLYDEGGVKKQALFRQRYIMKYDGETWLITDIEQVE